MGTCIFLEAASTKKNTSKSSLENEFRWLWIDLYTVIGVARRTWRYIGRSFNSKRRAGYYTLRKPFTDLVTDAAFALSESCSLGYGRHRNHCTYTFDRLKV